MTAPPTVAGTHAFLSEEPMDDRERLLALVDYVEQMIREALESQSVPADLRDHLLEGWNDPLAREAFARIRDAIPNVPEVRLVDNGLTGLQLEMKRRILAQLDAVYRRAVTARPPSSLSQVVAGLFGWRTPRPEDWILKKIFEVLRSAWGSLLAALNLGELAKELMDFIYGCIQDDVQRMDERRI